MNMCSKKLEIWTSWCQKVWFEEEKVKWEGRQRCCSGGGGRGGGGEAGSMLVNEGPGYPLQRHTVPLNLFSAHTLCLLHTGLSRMNICIIHKCIFWWPYTISYSSTLLNFYMITLHYTSHSARANIYFMKMLPFSLIHMIILNYITRATQAYYVCHDICLLHM